MGVEIDFLQLPRSQDHLGRLKGTATRPQKVSCGTVTVPRKPILSLWFPFHHRVAIRSDFKEAGPVGKAAEMAR